MPLPLEDYDTLTGRELTHLLQVQEQVISRDQLRRAGYHPSFGRGKVRSGRWRRIHPGVYLTNSGEASLRARMWAALLAAPRGAVLAGESAAFVDGWLAEAPRELEVVVPHSSGAGRTLTGVTIRRQRRPISSHGVLPRTTVEATALDRLRRSMSGADVIGLVTAAARTLGSSDPLRRELERRRGVPHGRLLREVLSVENEGHDSLLAWRFTHDVMIRHGLPVPRRQVVGIVDGRRTRGDQVLEAFRVRFELDGRVHLDKTDDDVWRDNAVLLEQDQTTLRYRWRHVIGRACATAVQVERALQRGGWSGQARPCGPGCEVGRPGAATS